MELTLPMNYVELEQDEMMYLDGGIAVSTVATIIGTTLTVLGAGYKVGEVAAQRVYYAGLRNATYQKIKWYIRGLIIGTTSWLGAATMMGFENKFYSLI